MAKQTKSKYEVGKEYDVDHARKGKFRIRVDAVNGELVTGTITHGLARYMSEPNRGSGDIIEILTDKTWITLTPV